MTGYEPFSRIDTSRTADMVDFPAQNPFGPEHDPVTLTMRMGIVHTYKHLGQANIVLASRLIPGVVLEPDGTFLDWKDLTHQGFPGNFMYTKGFSRDVTVGQISVPVPRNGNVFGILTDSGHEILDYGWFEGSDLPGIPSGHDDLEVIGATLWARN